MDDRASRTRVVEHGSAQGAWRMTFLTPTERLAPFVQRFNAYAERDTGFARRREPPSGLATLVINLGEALRVEHPTGTHTAYRAGHGFYSGLSRVYAVTETDRSQIGAQVMLTPLGARRLLGFPLEEVGDRMIDAVDLFGPTGREMIERLQEANSQSRQLEILEREMERRLLLPHAPVARDLVWALRRLRTSGGRIKVAALAGEIGCSRKHLTMRFKKEFGLAPKPFARVLRFDRALRLLANDGIANWAELADACGYADQAHLSRDFRACVGSPPEAFLRLRLPDNGGFMD